MYVPHDVLGLDRTASMVTESGKPACIPHANDPLQSVFIALIMISGVLLVGIVN